MWLEREPSLGATALIKRIPTQLPRFTLKPPTTVGILGRSTAHYFQPKARSTELPRKLLCNMESAINAIQKCATPGAAAGGADYTQKSSKWDNRF